MAQDRIARLRTAPSSARPMGKATDPDSDIFYALHMAVERRKRAKVVEGLGCRNRCGRALQYRRADAVVVERIASEKNRIRRQPPCGRQHRGEANQAGI